MSDSDSLEGIFDDSDKEETNRGAAILPPGTKKSEESTRRSSQMMKQQNDEDTEDSLEGIFDDSDNDETHNSGTTPLLPPGTKNKSEKNTRSSQMMKQQNDEDTEDSLEGIFDDSDNDETNKSGSGTTPLLPPGTKKKSEESTRWSRMTEKQKQKQLKRIAQYKRMQYLKKKVAKQKLLIKDLHTEMKLAMESVLPLNSKDDQILFLKEHIGDVDDFNLLGDLELKVKYASVYLFRKDRPNMSLDKFRKHYQKQYLE